MRFSGTKSKKAYRHSYSIFPKLSNSYFRGAPSSQPLR